MNKLFSIVKNFFALIGIFTVISAFLIFLVLSVKTGMSPVDLTKKIIGKGLTFIAPEKTEPRNEIALDPDLYRPAGLSPHVSISPMNENILYGRRILRVGPTRKLKQPSDAAKMCKKGDIIEIDAGIYLGDVALWNTPEIIIRGVGGRAILDAGGKAFGEKALWVVRGDNVFIENIGFENCKVRDRNGAGIRMEGDNLKIRNCLFWNNENGILSGKSKNDSSLTVRYSEFGFNGHGDGQSHGIYVGAINRFIFEFNYVHHTRVGNQVKSRARINRVAYNFITDGENGNSSYAIDLEDGGKAVIIGNAIHKSRFAENSAMIHYGMPNSKAGTTFYVINNTSSSDRSSAIFVLNHSPAQGIIGNNLLVGTFKIFVGKAEDITNMIASESCFSPTVSYIYALGSECKAINAGKIFNEIDGIDLVPRFEYVYPLSKMKRILNDHIDIGAYEYSSVRIFKDKK